MESNRLIGEIAGVVVLLLAGAVSSWWGMPWYVAGAVVLVPLVLLGSLAGLQPDETFTTRLSSIPAADPSLPRMQRIQIEATCARLAAPGFRLVGPWLSNRKGLVQAVCQHPKTGDVFTVTVKDSRFAIELRRARADGSSLQTSATNRSLPWPADPRDDVVCLFGHHDPLDVWHLHRARVERDPLAMANSQIVDPLAYRTSVVRAETERVTRAGYARSLAPDTMLLTARGTIHSLLARLRLRNPIARWRSNRILRSAPRT